MKTKLLSLFFFCFGLNQLANAQTYRYNVKDSTAKSNPTHHLAFQAGVATLPQILNGLGEVLYYAFSAGSNRYTNKTRTGGLYAQYHYSPNRQIRFGLSVGLDNQQGDIERESSTTLYTKYGAYYNKTKTIGLECLFVYNKNERTKLYGKIGLSMHEFSQTVTYTNPAARDVSVKYNYFSGQLTPFGIEIGKQVSGFAEFGFGYNGILSAGIRGKF